MSTHEKPHSRATPRRATPPAGTPNPWAGLDPDAVGNAQLDDAYLASEESGAARRAKEIEEEERLQQIITARRAHIPFRTIANQLGISAGHACRLHKKALARLVPIEDLEDARTAELDRLDRLAMTHFERAVGGDEDATRMYLGIVDRVIKIAGLDKHVEKIELDVGAIDRIEDIDREIVEMVTRRRNAQFN